MSLTPEMLRTAALEAPLAPASSSPFNGGCGLQGKGLGMNCEALGNRRKSMEATNQCWESQRQGGRGAGRQGKAVGQT